MTEKAPSLNVNRPLGVLEPEKENAYPIPLSDWSFLRDKVDRIEDPSLTYNTVGSVLLGISGSSLLAAVGLPQATESVHIGVHLLCWMLFVFCLLGGIVVLYFDTVTRKRYATQTKNDVIEEMDRMQKRFRIGTLRDEPPSDDAPKALPQQGQELTNVTPDFLVGKWLHGYLDHASGQFVYQEIAIDANGKYTIVGEPEPKIFLMKFNLEWSERIITFDKRDIASGKTLSRERLHIKDAGKLLIGEVKGKAGERKEYRKAEN